MKQVIPYGTFDMLHCEQRKQMVETIRYVDKVTPGPQHQHHSD